ncbi:hypothetical protein LY632_06265 [Erythrobacter sp. SDW2]|uniref:hypothetical protein n=1 Tax=Erythrobacter sp. SDW2 TaxID=2907154 RepID=UPI001F41F155|nr:hypothetical protein [Erythrobacter sp. SDW2]UIP07998.1 hypothetical protein LY632_06265 [Erythrobacter sp. SDW2]
MTPRRLLAALAPLVLVGCITPLPDLTQSRSPCRMEPGGWCDFVREAALASYGYAMLSSNAYQDEDTYLALPLAFQPRQAAGNDGSGLAYSMFDRFEVKDGKRGKLLARVIAFRGTEGASWNDLFSGTLGDRQRSGARTVYAAERAALDEAGMSEVAIEVTGHSLGGALATQISIEHPEVKAYLFNTSPFFTGDPMLNDINRLAISERGEFLRLLRRYKVSAASEQVVINCNPTVNAGSKHSIRKLADCLTWIAAYGDSEALTLVRRNLVKKPEVECGPADKVHPGLGSRRMAEGESLPVCVHEARPPAKGQVQP